MAPKTSRAEWRVLFHPCPASFGVYSPLRIPYILELLTDSGFETSRHYLAGVSQKHFAGDLKRKPLRGAKTRGASLWQEWRLVLEP